LEWHLATNTLFPKWHRGRVREKGEARNLCAWAKRRVLERGENSYLSSLLFF